MALCIRDWTGGIPRDNRLIVRVIRTSLARRGDRCDVTVYIAPVGQLRPSGGRSTTLQIPTSVHDMYLFGGDVTLQADTSMGEGSDLVVTHLFLGEAAYAVSA